MIMCTLVCIVSSTAIQLLHFRKADVNDLYPAIKFAAGLSADTATSVPRSFTVCSPITNNTPSSFINKISTAIRYTSWHGIIDLSLLCSKIHLLFFPAIPKKVTYNSFFFMFMQYLFFSYYSCGR